MINKILIVAFSNGALLKLLGVFFHWLSVFGWLK